MLTRLSLVCSLLLAAGTATFTKPGGGGGSQPAQHPIAAQDVVDLLESGNRRFANGTAEHRNTDPKRVLDTADGQNPFVTVLSCSDSRVPVETVFDRGVGDVFVVRVAGNVSTASTAASVEYGVAHLGTPLLVVMGHTGCGAVNAAVSGAELHEPLRSLIDEIRPAVAEAQRETPKPKDSTLVDQAVRFNVFHSIAGLLEESPTIAERAAQGGVRVVGAVYDLSSGRIDWLGEHPHMAALVERSVARAATAEHTAPKAAGARPVAAKKGH